ncbi:MAG: AAA family ATPase [Methyloprofundus sp.]|nr:AAA family ATPase [Methyloprofundus sp.]MBW6452811.1 AAA family ATPase [Methyloprofundus sp.]
MLNRVTIKGFKSIRLLENFELNDLNVLIGGNGAGKSNFIEFFRLMSAMMKPDGLKQFIAGNADTYLFGGAKETQLIDIEMSFGKNGYDFELAPTEQGFFLINNEKRHYFPYHSTKNLGSGNFNPQLLDDKNGTGLHAQRGASSYTYDAICSWKIYHFHDTTEQAGMRRLHDMGHNEVLLTDAANIAPFLFYLQEIFPVEYQAIRETISLVIPFFDDFILSPNKDENIRLNWRQKGLSDYPMRPTQLSDGAIRFICLATALLQPKPPSTIVIDEPELGLHPYAIEILAELFQSASKRMQVIISTQSPALVDCFQPEDIVVVNRVDGASNFTRLNEIELSSWLEDYSLGDLWRKNIISASPNHE